MLRQRFEQALLEQALAEAPITALFGARQVGKTTLGRALINRPARYFTFDDPAVVDAATRDAGAFISASGGREALVVLDEAQRVPSLFPALKLAAVLPLHKNTLAVPWQALLAAPLRTRAVRSARRATAPRRPRPSSS